MCNQFKRNKMSKFEVDSDGFQVVKSKHSAKNKHTKLPNKGQQFTKQEIVVDIEKAHRCITTAVEELKESQYLRDVIKSVSNVIKDKLVVEIVSFGLGQISECNIARHQLAFLLCFVDFCKCKKVLAHDPIFYKYECDILKQFGIDIIAENNEGSYIISDQGITLVYLPHCPKQLTNNFLWSNWDRKLQNCVIICNSFSSLIDNNLNRVLSDTVPYIYNLYPYTEEIVLKNNYKYSDIFNDTSIHCFPKDKLDSVPLYFWQKGAKPSYKDTEEFVTSLMVEKLNI